MQFWFQVDDALDVLDMQETFVSLGFFVWTKREWHSKQTYLLQKALEI